MEGIEIEPDIEVQTGMIIVKPTDLIYIESRNKVEWEWPLRLLQHYSYDGNVLSFEAGKKCKWERSSTPLCVMSQKRFLT